MTCKKFIAAALVTLPLTFGGTAALAQEIVIGAAANPGGMVVFVAQEKGLFAKNGVDAKVEVRNTGPELSRGLRAGEFQFTPAAFTNLPAALERGLDVRGVVGYVGAAYVKPTSDNQMGIIAAKDSGIETIADLVGKNIGVTFGTTGDTYLQALLAAHDILITDVGRVNTAPPSLTSVLDTGGVDAIVAWAPFLERTLERVEGSKLINRGGDHTCFCAYLHGTPETVYGNEAATQAIVDAMAEAAAFVRNPANLDEVAEIGGRFANMTPDEIRVSLQYWGFDPRIGDNTAKAFEDAVEQLIAQRKMRAPYDPWNYLEPKFIRSTMERHPEWFADLETPN